MNAETPSIASSYYNTNALQLGSVGNLVQEQRWNLFDPQNQLDRILGKQTQTPVTIMPNNTNRRYVQVFIADPNENVPLEESVLFKGEQKLTDLTDTELFFEVPIADTLKAHNEKRVKWNDKEATKRAGKDVFLDPVKIRDLRMVVVTIAEFK